MIGISIVIDRLTADPFLTKSALGEALSQHQQAFYADGTSDVARVARRVLSLLAAGDPSAIVGEMAGPSPSPQTDLTALAQRLQEASYGPDPQHFASALRAIEAAGFSDDTLAFELIPSIARQLGKCWVDDVISFADVTIGCARLQSALRRLPDDTSDGRAAHLGKRPGCLVMVPRGAQHTLGALVLAKQLRHAHQSVVVELEADENVLSKLADQHQFGAVLISASRSECPQGLVQLVQLARQHWPTCKVVVGGSISDLKSDLVNDLGADRVTNDWEEALDLCI